MLSRKTRRYSLAAIVLLFVSGCVRESADGPNQIFTYELWVPFSVLFSGLVAAPAGWFLRKTSARLGWGLLIAGLVATLFFTPSLFRDRAVVADTAFSLRTGIWGLTAVHDVKYDDLKRIRIISEEVSGRRGSSRTNYYLLCERSDGTTEKIPVSNNVAQAAAPYFLKKASARGIPVVDET